jgi:hypothetical protein
MRLRGCLGYSTDAADAELTRRYNAFDRERMLATVCRRIAQVLPGLRSERARRTARREAIDSSVEEPGLAEWTRSGG